MPTLVFTPAAQGEVAEALDWYEQQSPGLGESLIVELNRIAGRIVASPLHFPMVHKDVRRALLRRYPYAIFFRVAEDEIQVIACFNTRRDPTHWRERI
jgi:plasmid stabilization system protein ParE